MPDLTDMVPLTEYAESIGKHPDIVRQKILRGTMPGAVKIGRDWFIPRNAPYPDRRIKSGKYTDWRRQKPSDSGPASDSGPV